MKKSTGFLLGIGAGVAAGAVALGVYPSGTQPGAGESMYQEVAREMTRKMPPTILKAVSASNLVSRALARGATMREAMPHTPTAMPEAKPFLSGNQLTAVTTPGV